VKIHFVPFNTPQSFVVALQTCNPNARPA
jgi:hypothetical protein